jgi:RNA polymerase sigma factor (sigma-70 family)
MLNVEMKEELRQIIEGCIRNERKYQEKLFKIYYGKMLMVCKRYTMDDDSAQEILQNGFIKIFEKLEMFDFKGSFDGWVRRIIANTAIDSIRKLKRMPYLSDTDSEFVTETENKMEEEEEVEFKTIQANIALEAVEELTPGYRAVFNLYVFEEYTHKEIAEILGISEGTSKSNLAKAKQNLQRIIAKKTVKFNQE